MVLVPCLQFGVIPFSDGVRDHPEGQHGRAEETREEEGQEEEGQAERRPVSMLADVRIDRALQPRDTAARFVAGEKTQRACARGACVQ
jgi:hypothetical protein